MKSTREYSYSTEDVSKKAKNSLRTEKRMFGYRRIRSSHYGISVTRGGPWILADKCLL